MSLTITIDDDTIAKFENREVHAVGSRYYGIRAAIRSARASLERGEVKITLSEEAANEFNFNWPGLGALEAKKACRAFRAEQSTSYELWLASLGDKEKLAWEAMQTTHKALKAAYLGYSEKHLRKMAATEFGDVCLEGLPE